MMMQNEVKRKLPDEFQAVEWVGWEGASESMFYNICPDVRPIKIECEMTYSQLTATHQMNGCNGTAWGIDKNGYWHTSIWDESGTVFCTNTMHTVIIENIVAGEPDNYILTVDGEVVQSKKGATIEPTRKYLNLGTLNSGASLPSKYGRYKTCKIYTDEGIVRDFVACYRKDTGLIGMYDLIGNLCNYGAGAGTPLWTSYYRTSSLVKGADI